MNNQENRQAVSQNQPKQTEGSRAEILPSPNPTNRTKKGNKMEEALDIDLEYLTIAEVSSICPKYHNSTASVHISAEDWLKTPKKLEKQQFFIFSQILKILIFLVANRRKKAYPDRKPPKKVHQPPSRPQKAPNQRQQQRRDAAPPRRLQRLLQHNQAPSQRLHGAGPRNHAQRPLRQHQPRPGLHLRKDLQPPCFRRDGRSDRLNALPYRQGAARSQRGVSYHQKSRVGPWEKQSAPLGHFSRRSSAERAGV